jgi:hypothetical protein
VERFVAYLIGNQRAVIFNAHPRTGPAQSNFCLEPHGELVEP